MVKIKFDSIESARSEYPVFTPALHKEKLIGVTGCYNKIGEVNSGLCKRIASLIALIALGSLAVLVLPLASSSYRKCVADLYEQCTTDKISLYVLEKVVEDCSTSSSTESGSSSEESDDYIDALKCEKSDDHIDALKCEESDDYTDAPGSSSEESADHIDALERGEELPASSDVVVREQQSAPFYNVHSEIQAHIVSFCSLKVIGRLGFVSKLMNALVNLPSIWQNLCLKEEPLMQLPAETTWKEFYLDQIWLKKYQGGTQVTVNILGRGNYIVEFDKEKAEGRHFKKIVKKQSGFKCRLSDMKLFFCGKVIPDDQSMNFLVDHVPTCMQLSIVENAGNL